MKRKSAVIQSKFPRLLRWIDYKVGDVSIRSSFKNNVVLSIIFSSNVFGVSSFSNLLMLFV